MDKGDFYLAQIAFEIYTFHYAFSKWIGSSALKPKQFKEFILDFAAGADQKTVVKETVSRAEEVTPGVDPDTPGGKKLTLAEEFAIQKAADKRNLPPAVLEKMAKSKMMWAGVLKTKIGKFAPPKERKSKKPPKDKK